MAELGAVPDTDAQTRVGGGGAAGGGAGGGAAAGGAAGGGAEAGPVGKGQRLDAWLDALDPALESLTVGDPMCRDMGNHGFAELSGASLYSQIPKADKTALIAQVMAECPRSPCAKAMGALVGLAAADATGHWFEFMPACDRPAANAGSTIFDVSKLAFVPADQSQARPMPNTPAGRPACFSGEVFNKFALQMGQWTDDCSMGLAMGDSLIVRQNYHGPDIRTRFWNWWNKGYCNAFGHDTSMGPRASVGLGGNISKSIYSMKQGEKPTERFESSGEDSGNGSLMRLAPIPIFFSSADPSVCMHAARESSYTTHPGAIAAECCAFLAWAVAKAIHDPELPLQPAAGGAEAITARQWLERTADEYLSTQLQDASGADRTGVGVDEVRKLLLSREPPESLERNWNWRASLEEGLEIEGTLRRRGHRYNGHPVSAGYFGSYAVDGLAVALHSVAATTSMDAAIERCINFLGDADTTAAIAGQLAGAIYGLSLNEAFVQNLQQWDDGDVAVRAYMLHFLGERVAAAKAAAKESAHTQAQQVSMLRVSGFPTLTATMAAKQETDDPFAELEDLCAGEDSTALNLGSFNGEYTHTAGDNTPDGFPVWRTGPAARQRFLFFHRAWGRFVINDHPMLQDGFAWAASGKTEPGPVALGHDLDWEVFDGTNDVRVGLTVEDPAGDL